MINKVSLEFRIMRKFDSVLVTGGAGYIGSVLTGNLVESGYKVKVLDSLIFGSNGISRYISNDSVELISDDMRDIQVIEKAIRRRIITAQSLYAAGALLCFINTYLSIAVIIMVQLNYALAFFSKPESKTK